MHRGTLDIIFSVGGVVLAGLLLVLGLIVQNQANFGIAGLVHAHPKRARALRCGLRPDSLAGR